MSRIEPRREVADQALASGDINAWRQALGFPPVEQAAPACPNCEAVAEQWWSYCAMCGWHIASRPKGI